MTNATIIQDYMKDSGIRILFRNGRYSSYQRKGCGPLEYAVRSKVLNSEALISKHLDLAKENGDSDLLFAIFKHAEDADINLYNIPFWRSHVDTIAQQLLSDDVSSYEIYNGTRDYALTAAKMLEDFRWKDLFLKVFESQKVNNYIRLPFKVISEMYAFHDPESFKDFAEEKIFFSKEGKPSYATRGSMYRRYIEGGFLCNKTARKIRSDASEDASANGLKALVENKSLYQNYDDLLLQFTDSKYDSVIIHLAENLPEYLITSILGTQSYWGKKAVEDRMERIEAERESKRLELEREAMEAVT